MAKNDNIPAEEAGGGSVGDWIVTFSDCMTLLLCFFVLLLTFSSFDDAALKRFSGSFDFDQMDSAFTDSRDLKDSMTEPPVHIMDRSTSGSEVLTEDLTEDPTKRPESQWTPEDDAYRDRKVISIPSDRLFARGKSTLSPAGKGYLSSLAGFVRALPSQMVICETSPKPTYGRVPWSRLGLDRAWSVMEHLTDSEGLPGERLSISATRLDRSQKTTGRPVVQIVLMAREVYE
jgi:chemotaxis protein MotB